MAVHDIFNLGEQKHQAPVGASFAPSAWIGPFQAAHVYTVGWVEFDLAQLYDDYNADLTTCLTNEDEVTSERWVDILVSEVGVADMVQKSQSGKFKYYYRDYDKAAALARLLDKEEPALTRSNRTFKRRPEHRWRIEGKVSEMLTLTDEAKEKFESDVLAWEVEQKGIAKNSPDWFAWHGLVLPNLVYAYAKLMGWDVPPLDMSEFLVPEDEFIVTDKLQLELIGNTDVGPNDSALFIRRKALWGVLGEDDPKVSDPEKTESEKLAAALTVATHDWQSPVYCRIVHLPSPRVDDVWERNGQRRRNRIPVITSFYGSSQHAENAAKSEHVEEEVQSVAKSAGSNEFYVPDAWAEFPDDWKNTAATLKAEVTDGQPRPLPVVKQKLVEMTKRLKDEFMVTPDDLLKVWDLV